MASHNRAKAYIACGNLDLALEDAIRSITLARMWPEVIHFVILIGCHIS